MLGINLNFGPVADINSNIDNPVIQPTVRLEPTLKTSPEHFVGQRSMQDERIIVSAKLFQATVTPRSTRTTIFP